ncbi:MAG: TIM barrel protein [Treponema sp.]|jgi:sugar phosphate isomerase/epimerase|nr:TIM barrel protein [Treponema sp.]
MEGKTYPRIYLAIDNCFAYKRWTRPEEWCSLIAQLGVNYAEASADTELDPLYMGAGYLSDWIPAVEKAAASAGICIANLYSGHGTYTTLGLTHTDLRVRRRMIDEWFKPMITGAARLHAGLGFFAHAFPHETLQNADRYEEMAGLLRRGLVELNQFASSCGCGVLGIEQMYSPHQYPWTMAQTKTLLRRVTKESGRPFYFTEDLGHHHTKFQRPPEDMVRNIKTVSSAGQNPLPRGLWLGSDRAFALAEAGAAGELAAELDRIPHLFAEEKDGNCYAWLSELGCYSPIIHLQQTDGHTSSHLPFTGELNQWGIIDGGRVLAALKAAYDRPEEGQMPGRCDAVYMTLELFTGAAAIPRDVLEDIRESVAYWRRWIPRDGMYLNELTG